MARAGFVKIYITPADAKIVADWLATYRARQSHNGTTKGSWGSILAAAVASADEHDLAPLTHLFQKVAARKRKFGYPAAKVLIQVTRDDARWFATKGKCTGLAGRRFKAALPPVIACLAIECADATSRKRGRPGLSGDDLEDAINAHAAADPDEDRHLRRLIKRSDIERTARKRGLVLQGLLNFLIKN